MTTIRRHVGHAVHAGELRPARQGEVEVINLSGCRAPSGKWSKVTVKRRVSDWIRRLNDLFDQMDGWVAGVPGARVRRASVAQMSEYPMQESGIQPRTVPAWTVFIGKKRIAFVPDSIWIIGANGRIDVISNTKTHDLIDLGGIENRPSDWQLVDMSRKTMRRPFDRAAFLELLEE